MKQLHTVLFALLIFSSPSFFSQSPTNSLWTPINESEIRRSGVRQIAPQKYLTHALNQEQMRSKLAEAPHEKNVVIQNSTCFIYLPLPNGRIQQFKIVESPIMAPALAAAFPNIKTYSLKGVDDPYANGKIDWNEFGFHAMVLSPAGDFFIDPYCVGNTEHYQSYYTADFVKEASQRIQEDGLEGVEEQQQIERKEGEQKTGSKSSSAPPAVCVGAQLRTYRLAVACTGEYAKASTGSTGTVIPTVAQVLSKIVTTVNRVDGVYEREVSVRMELVATQTLIVFTNPATDPFNGNNNAGTLINESQTVITNTIGSTNFDIGHTFSTGGGGLAFLGAVCVTANKARGITGSSNPVGDPYDIDYVAHEIGHQFRGNHTFNAITGSCNGNRSSTAAVEPGSGVTIMGYAGICQGNNVANNSIAYFHAISYDEIVNFTHTGAGNSCPVISNTGNNAPVVSTVANHVIPKGTPFVLSGSATDVDGDKLFYSWEQTDLGTAGANWNSGSRPYFRSYVPDTIAPTDTVYSRFFPRKSVIVNGNYTGTIGEYLPQTAQTLNFRLTARDNKMGGGGVCYALNTVTIDEVGPLMITYPDANGIVWPISTSQTITWDVNATNLAPVSCDSVQISISYDSGNTFSVIIAATANDGAETITAPTLSASISTCRIRVSSIGNIFYDVSNRNFTISTTANENTVGITQVSKNNPIGLMVWPNPSSEYIRLVAGNLSASSETKVSIVDIMGKTAFEFSYSGKTEINETIALSALSKGVYFVKVHNASNQSVHRIVKN